MPAFSQAWMTAAPCSIMTFLPSMLISTSAAASRGRGVDANDLRAVALPTAKPLAVGFKPRNIHCRVML